MVNKMKHISFDEANDASWKEIAIKSLRGMPFEKLITKTAEGIEINPLYTKESLEKTLHDTLDEMTKTIRHTKTTSTWTIAQQNHSQTSEAFIEELQDALERGNEAVVYDGTRKIDWSTESLTALAEMIVNYPVYALDIDEDDSFLGVFELVELSKRKSVKGAVTATNYTLPDGYEQIRTIALDVRDIHHDGADIITELAVILAKAAEKAGDYKDFKTFEEDVLVRISIDTEFFLEISKIRAFRVLWQTFAEAYGHEAYSWVPVYSENSLRTYSKLDEYVNLLRAGNEALAAAIGGTDILTIHPHDILTGSNPLTARFARNVQLVIKEETYVDEVIDPSGGSYFIETLTNEFIERAWAYFVEIEAQGGYSAFVEKGLLAEKVTHVREERRNLVAHNKKSLIGTNVYADLDRPAAEETNPLNVENRLAEPYEKLREYFLGNQPKVVLLTFGELKDFKPRTDFVSGFLATGGLNVVHSPAFESVEAGRAWINDNEFDYGIICVSPKETEAVLNELITDFPPNKWIDVAGKYEGEEADAWKLAGVSDFIYKGQNQIEKINEIKQSWEEVLGNE